MPTYDATFQNHCNEVSLTPMDIFLSLYSYVCSDCLYTTAKQGDVFAKALETHGQDAEPELICTTNIRSRTQYIPNTSPGHPMILVVLLS
jgi:hypothetical protein